MPNVDLHKSPGQWGALVAAAALFWGVVWGVGSQFRDHLLADVRGLISAHADSATANRVEFFREIESKADGAVGRIGTMEQQCAIVRDWRTTVDQQLGGLQGWRERCGQKIERITQYMESDSAAIIEIKRRVEALETAKRR
jgi:hypothetical protein